MVTIGGAESAPPRGKEDILKAVGIRVNEQNVFYFGFFLINKIHDSRGPYQSLKMTNNTP